MGESEESRKERKGKRKRKGRLCLFSLPKNFSAKPCPATGSSSWGQQHCREGLVPISLALWHRNQTGPHTAKPGPQTLRNPIQFSITDPHAQSSFLIPSGLLSRIAFQRRSWDPGCRWGNLPCLLQKSQLLT